MSVFEAVVLGVGDTFSERHVTSALLLSYGGFNLALDCPDRYRGVLVSAGARAGRNLRLRDVDHVLVTHVHGDHMNGLEGVAFWKRFVEGRRLGLVCAPEVREAIWSQRLVGPMGQLFDGRELRPMGFEDYFEYTPLDWDRETQVGPFQIRAYRTQHHVPTSALLVEAGGRRLGYSADTAFDPRLIEFLQPADVVVHETNLGPAHTPYPSLAALPPEIRARMRLIHYPDEFDTASSNISVLREGELVRVGEPLSAPGARVVARQAPGWMARAAQGLRLLRRR